MPVYTTYNAYYGISITMFTATTVSASDIVSNWKRVEIIILEF